MPTIPRSSCTLTISRIVGTESRCWVSPIAQQTIVASELANIFAAATISSRDSPVVASVAGQSTVSAAVRYSAKRDVYVSTNARSTAPQPSSRAPIARKSALSPPTLICRYRSASGVPSPTSPDGRCGLRKRMSPASGSGLTARIRAPLRLARSSAVSMRGWLVPGFCPTITSSAARWMSSSVTVPLPTPIVLDSAVPEDSWHMFEQSGRLFVPYARAKSWYRKAASLEVRPDV